MHTEIDFNDPDLQNKGLADLDAAILYYEGIATDERTGDDIDQLNYLKEKKAEVEKAILNNT